MKFFTFFLDIVFPPRETELIVRNSDFSALQNLLHPTQIITDAYADVTYLLPYQSKLVQAFILEAKFHRNKKAQEFLGRILADYLLQSLDTELLRESVQTNYFLVPVPLGKKRLKGRGYNQVEEIARYAVEVLKEIQKNSPAKHKGWILGSDLLVRVKETIPQTSLGKAERLANMNGVFKVRPQLDSSTFSDKHTYIVIDDVVTTGASLLGAREALHNAGKQSIKLLALAH